MTVPDVKSDLHSYLRGARETLVWKLDGLGEYDIRRPLTPTGTNLLGLVKHSMVSHVRYFGDVFGRPQTITLPSSAGGPDHSAAFWATPDETREDLLALYAQAGELADQTITELSLDAIGRVPWWGDSEVSLQTVLVHMTAETQRHAGHADIVRELIDGAVGLLEGHDNLWLHDPAETLELQDRIEAAARLAGRGTTPDE